MMQQWQQRLPRKETKAVDFIDHHMQHKCPSRPILLTRIRGRPDVETTQQIHNGALIKYSHSYTNCRVRSNPHSNQGRTSNYARKMPIDLEATHASERNDKNDATTNTRTRSNKIRSRAYLITENGVSCGPRPLGRQRDSSGRTC